MSWNSPGWIPGAQINDDVPVCGRCGHQASGHHDAVSCSVPARLRGRWWRRCRCSGYIKFDPAAPPVAGPLRQAVVRHPPFSNH
jgi:hypothetical protein